MNILIVMLYFDSWDQLIRISNFKTHASFLAGVFDRVRQFFVNTFDRNNTNDLTEL